MLIQVGGQQSRLVCSQFWSRNTFCMVSYNVAHSWGHIRLWRSHPWLLRESELRHIATNRVSGFTQPRDPTEDSVVLCVSNMWVVFCCTAAAVQLPRGACMRPDRYWFRKKGKKLETDYELSMKYTEALCCYLCRVMSYTP